MKIVIVGSRDMVMPGPEITSAVLSIIVATPETTEIAVRGPKDTGQVEPDFTSVVEARAWKIATGSGRPAHIYRPQESHGRAMVFERDYTLVDNASKVYVFFSPGGVMIGGTGHVAKAAMDREVPVEAYTVDDQGHLVLVGSDDGGGLMLPLTQEELEALYLQVNGQ